MYLKICFENTMEYAETSLEASRTSTMELAYEIG